MHALACKMEGAGVRERDSARGRERARVPALRPDTYACVYARGSRCGCSFCAYCQRDCDTDSAAHTHVAGCAWNMRKEVFSKKERSGLCRHKMHACGASRERACVCTCTSSELVRASVSSEYRGGVIDSPEVSLVCLLPSWFEQGIGTAVSQIGLCPWERRCLI